MIKYWKIRGVIVLVCLLAVAEGFAQNFSQHNWYFGNSVRGIRFNRTDNTPLLVTNQALPFGTGGSAVATDPTNGNLLFYTDGALVFNTSHVQMTNGFGLNANTSSNQPVAISGVPGQPNQYYIFTNTASFTTGGTIAVTTVDMTLFGSEVFPSPPLGNVTTKNVAIGLTGRSEAMITVPHANGTDYWLITHQQLSGTYHAMQITDTGFSPPIPSTVGFDIVAANFSYHEATGKIAVSPQTADRNVIILDFDNATGALTFDQYVLNSAVSSVSNQANYDTEWSNSGQFLYISRHGEAGIPADVVQFDINNPVVSLTTVLNSAPARSYGLQMAPDSAIYHLYQATAGGPFLVGTLTNTDSIASSVIHTPDVFGGALNFNGTQFPSFSPRSTINLSVSFVTSGTCALNPVSFYPLVSPTADSLVWDFGDGQTSNQWSPIYTYQNGGAFNVSVTAFLNGQTAVGNGVVNLTAFDLQLSLVQDTTACRCEFPPPVGTSCNGGPFSVTVQTQGGSGGLTFNWSNGDTGSTLTPDSAGYYYVVVTDASGCSAYAGVLVREYDATDQRANIWYFGQNAGIDFNQQPPVSIGGPLNSPEGVSVISDRNGEVIFSTDGVRVYDRNDVEITTSASGAPIVVPPGIGGEQGSTQAALIIPVPGDETLFYIFTTQEIDQGNFELRYSLFDLKENNGDGGILEYNQLLFGPSTERITGNANWLIAHEFGNNYFRAYQITATGISAPVISSIGSDHGFSPVTEGQGYMKLGGNNILAVAYPSTGSNTIELFDFVDSTGVVINYRTVDTQQNTGQVYGIEFAGNKMFATIRGANSVLVEFFFDSLGMPFLIDPTLPDIGEELGAIQLGPDGQLYVAVNNRPYLGTIQVNSDTTQVSQITIPGFALTSGQSRLGLPNFIQSVGVGPQLAGMLVAGFCLGDSTSFTGIGTDPIDEFLWSFGDGFSSTSQIAQHLYAEPDEYIVTLRVTNRCGLDTLITQTITIVAPPANPNFLPLGQQPVLCTGELTLEAEPAPGNVDHTYLWSTGETTRIIIVSQQSIVSVTITNALGCTSDGSLLVADNRPQVNLGPDQTLCQNAPAGSLNAQNPGATFEWFLDDVLIPNTTQTQPVVTTSPGSVKYEVLVTDPITTCFVRDSLVFTINPSPVFTALPTNTTACGADNGEIALTITSPPSTLFSYLVVGAGTGTTFQDVDQSVGPVLPVFAPLPADTYVVQVTDQVSGCATFTSVGISDNVIAITSAIAQTPTCDPIIIDVQTSGIVSFVGATYSVINSGTGVQTIPPTTFSTVNFSTLAVPVPGNYTIQINAQGCIATFDLNIVSDPITPVTFLTDLCNAQITAEPAGAVSYDWSTSSPGSINGVTSNATASINIGTWDLVVIVNDGVNCPGTGNITVTVEPAVAANFTQSNACEDQVTLTATPTGSYTYRWQNVTTATPIIGGSSILVGLGDNGDVFGVEVVSTLTGCVSPLFTDQVFVAGDLQLSMTTTIPCTGNPFTLTGTSNIAGTNFQWGVNGSDIAGANQPTLNRTTSGVYRLTGTLPGCSESIEQQIILFPSTPGSLPARALICPDPANPDIETREVLLDAGTGFVSYQWFQNGAPSTNTTQTFLATEAALYSVELLNSFGCETIDQTDVVEECKPRVVAPTAFRPGSSTVANATFYIFTYFVDSEDFQLFIYNRWGELIYQSDELDREVHKWNGGYKNNPGQLLPAGTYTYVVKYKSSYRPQDGIQEKRGGVVLLR